MGLSHHTFVDFERRGDDSFMILETSPFQRPSHVELTNNSFIRGSDAFSETNVALSPPRREDHDN